MASDDLLNDALLLDDFAPDLDLLDDLLSLDMDMKDWKELEPSLAEQSQQHQQRQLQLQQQQLLQNLQHHQAPSPQQQQQILQSQQGQILIPNFAALSGGNGGGAGGEGPKVTAILPNGFCSPIYTTTAITLPQLQLALLAPSQGNGGDQEGSKIPMRRLEQKGERREEEGKEKGGRKPKEQTSRRSSHNAIERRYRSSINDKILELKSLVCHSSGSDKVHKAAILRNSIDTIRYLQNANGRLEKEVKSLRGAIQALKRCSSCGADQPVAIVTSSLGHGGDLRDLLTDNSPPPSSSSHDDSGSSVPSSPSSSIGGNKSPLVLFGLASGLFLLNPGSHSGGGHGPGHRVERDVSSVSSSYYTENMNVWTGRLVAMGVNLLLFMLIYWVFGRIFSGKGSPKKSMVKSRFTEQHVAKVEAEYARVNKKDVSALEQFLFSMTGERVPRGLTLWVKNIWLTVKAPLLAPTELAPQDQKMSLLTGRIYVDLAALNEEKGNSLKKYCGLQSFHHAINAVESREGQEGALNGVLLSKSRVLLTALVRRVEATKVGKKHPLLDEASFLTKFVGGGGNGGWEEQEVSVVKIVGSDPASMATGCFKEEMIRRGFSRLYYTGEGAGEWFKHALKALLWEKGGDHAGEWWAAAGWARTEGVGRDQRPPMLDRLYRIIEASYKHVQEDPLARAVYCLHKAKNEMFFGSLPSSRRLLATASSNLREAINLTTQRPSPLIQLIHAIAADWILELRLDLWERLGDVRAVDQEFSREFSRDLDLLRGVVGGEAGMQSSLPSLYLYESTLRLITNAAPSRTLHLLDLSLRNLRSTRSNLICTGDGGTKEIEEEGRRCKGNGNKKGSGQGSNRNLVWEKRKAMALYLKCKYLPSQVVTCPGEKAGMLREAMLGLERVGGDEMVKRRVGVCAEMMRGVVGA